MKDTSCCISSHGLLHGNEEDSGKLPTCTPGDFPCIYPQHLLNPSENSPASKDMYAFHGTGLGDAPLGGVNSFHPTHGTAGLPMRKGNHKGGALPGSAAASMSRCINRRLLRRSWLTMWAKSSISRLYA